MKKSKARILVQIHGLLFFITFNTNNAVESQFGAFDLLSRPGEDHAPFGEFVLHFWSSVGLCWSHFGTEVDTLDVSPPEAPSIKEGLPGAPSQRASTKAQVNLWRFLLQKKT